MSAGLEKQLTQLTDEKNLQVHQWNQQRYEMKQEIDQLNQQRDEMKQKIKSLKTETKILKIENGDQGQQIRRQETMIRDQGQQITRLETENEVKEQQLIEMSHQISQLVNSSKEKTELLQGQGQDIAGLLVTNDFTILVVSLELSDYWGVLAKAM